MKKYLFIIICLSKTILFAQEIEKTKEEILLAARIPEWVMPIIEKNSLQKLYIISDTINPFYLEADFNGDKEVDIALFMISKETGKAGILIIHRKTNMYYVLGGGKDFGMGDSMSWVKNWNVFRGKNLTSLAGGSKIVALKNPAIRIYKTEDISAYFYWAGKKYKTFNQVNKKIN